MDKNVKLLDCPGIVFAEGEELDEGAVMLRNCVKIEQITDPFKPGTVSHLLIHSIER